MQPPRGCGGTSEPRVPRAWHGARGSFVPPGTGASRRPVPQKSHSVDRARRDGFVDDRIQVPGDFRRSCREPRGPLVSNTLDDLETIRFFEGRSLSGQLVEAQTQAINVGPWIAPALEPFGSHVTYGTRNLARVGQVVNPERLCQSEVGHPYDSLAIQQEVRRLDVAMQDALTVRIIQRIRNLDADTSHGLEVTRCETRLR